MEKWNFINKRFWFLFALFVLGLSAVQAQEKVVLNKALVLLESKFDIKFSYANASVESLEVPSKILQIASLSEVVDYLNSNTVFLN